MSTQTEKVAWKLYDFTAHSTNVTCLCLGQKSGRVLATGGDDKKVNLWAVGKPQCIMSLGGHSSTIESVKFNTSEEQICAGGQTGTLKLWDLEAARLVRSLTGHKSSLNCIDFHPYGDFIASGSSDTLIKLWDVRKKGCLFTYSGHEQSVNVLKFSPDGQLIASGGEEGNVRIWDLRAGKLSSDLADPFSSSITDVVFHPNEFFLASAHSKAVNFWDLESEEITSTSRPYEESLVIRKISFHPSQQYLYSISNDQICVHKWEPHSVLSSTASNFGRVKDVAFSSNHLICASNSMSNVTLHMVDVDQLHTLKQVARTDSFDSTIDCVNTLSSNVTVQRGNSADLRMDSALTSSSEVFEPTKSLESDSGFTKSDSFQASISKLTQKVPSQNVSTTNKSNLVRIHLPKHDKDSKNRLTEESRKYRTCVRLGSTSPTHSSHGSVGSIYKSMSCLTEQHDDNDFTSPSKIAQLLASVRQPFRPRNRELSRTPPPPIHVPSIPVAQTTWSSHSSSTTGLQSSSVNSLSTTDTTDSLNSLFNSRQAISTARCQSSMTNSPPSSSSQLNSKKKGVSLPRQFSLQSSVREDNPPTTSKKVDSNTNSWLSKLRNEFSSSSKIYSLTDSSSPQQLETTPSPINSTTLFNHSKSSETFVTTADNTNTDGDIQMDQQSESTSKFVTQSNPTSSKVADGEKVNSVGVVTSNERMPVPKSSIIMNNKRQVVGFPNPTATSSSSTAVMKSGHSKPIAIVNAATKYVQMAPPLSNPVLTDHDDTAATIHMLQSGHQTVFQTLKSRSHNLQLVYGVWVNKGVKCALDYASSSPQPNLTQWRSLAEESVNSHSLVNNRTVLIDLLHGVMLTKPALWSLDICTILLPHLYVQLSSNIQFVHHTTKVCCESLVLILKTFGQLIKTNVDNCMMSNGGHQTDFVDIPREERQQKCMLCYKELVKIRSCVSKRLKEGGFSGGSSHQPSFNALKELSMLMQNMD